MSEVDATTTHVRKAVGTMIDGRYRLDGVVGAGGFAVVYRAIQLNLDQPVAIKILNMRNADPEVFVQRFLREAKTAAQIRHPGIVNILDFGVTGEAEPYMVLELLDGLPLFDFLVDRGPMEPRRVRNLFVHCLDGLEAAHSQGIVHRDLKPGNIFLTGVDTMSEALKILDFGCAFMMDDANRLTGTNARIGTPQYLAPEYAQHHAISPALDVYQMGLILVECLTGEPAVDAENPYQCILAHCSGNLQIPRVLIDSALGPVVRKSLAIDVNERYQTAGEFRDALQAVLPETLPATIEPDHPGRVEIADTPGGIPPETLDGVVQTTSAGPVVVPAPKTSQGAVMRKTRKRPHPVLLAIAAVALLLGGALAGLLVLSYIGAQNADAPVPTAASGDEPSNTTAVDPPTTIPVVAKPSPPAAVVPTPDTAPQTPPKVDDAVAPVAVDKRRRRPSTKSPGGSEVVEPPAEKKPVKKRGLGIIEDDSKKKIGILD